MSNRVRQFILDGFVHEPDITVMPYTGNISVIYAPSLTMILRAEGMLKLIGLYAYGSILPANFRNGYYLIVTL